MKIFSWKRGHEEKKKLSNTIVSNWNKHCLKTQAKVAVAAGTFCEFVSWDELWMWLMRAKRDLFVRGVKKKFSTVKCFKETVKDSTTSRPGRLMFSTTASCALPISCVMCAEMEAPGHSERRTSERPRKHGRLSGWPGAVVEDTPPWCHKYKNGKKFLLSRSFIESNNSGRGDITPLIAEVRWGR